MALAAAEKFPCLLDYNPSWASVYMTSMGTVFPAINPGITPYFTQRYNYKHQEEEHNPFYGDEFYTETPKSETCV